PPCHLNVQSLHRLTPLIPCRPYGLVVGQENGALVSRGIARLERSGMQLSPFPEIVISEVLYGLHLTISGPGKLTAKAMLPDRAVATLGLRSGEISPIYDAVSCSYTSYLCTIWRQEIVKGAEVPLIRWLWGTVLALAKDLGHGGAFVFIPKQDDLNTESHIALRVPTQGPDLGSAAVRLQTSSPQTVWAHYSACLDAAVSTARLSAIDGCVLLDNR